MVSAELYLANLKMLDKLFEPIVCVCLSIYRIHVKMLKIYHWPLQRVHKTGWSPNSNQDTQIKLIQIKTWFRYFTNISLVYSWCKCGLNRRYLFLKKTHFHFSCSVFSLYIVFVICRYICIWCGFDRQP